jgi:hypothetical protein
MPPSLCPSASSKSLQKGNKQFRRGRARRRGYMYPASLQLGQDGRYLGVELEWLTATTVISFIY